MKLKCIIVDDEPPAIRLLENYVAKITFLDKVGSFSDSLQALAFLGQNEVDVVFLDIQMPQLTGLQLSKIIPKSCKVIFTTAYPDFALEGFDLNATDYLLKPIAFERFYQAASKLNTPPVATAPVMQQDFLFVRTDGKNKLSKVFIRDILYAEALQNYVCLHTTDTMLITHSSLKNILESLPSTDFVQIHKSYVIALQHIESTDNFSVFLHGKELPVGATYKDAFFRKIEEYKI